MIFLLMSSWFALGASVAGPISATLPPQPMTASAAPKIQKRINGDISVPSLSSRMSRPTEQTSDYSFTLHISTLVLVGNRCLTIGSGNAVEMGGPFRDFPWAAQIAIEGDDLADELGILQV